MGFLLILLVLAVIIAVHESGHLLLAKLFGVGVKRFSVGFGPIILHKKFGETKYALSAIPLGGYVSMVGELNSGEETSDPKSYNSKPRWQRIIILLAGPGFNFMFGALIILLSFSIFGTPTITNRIIAIVDKSPAALAGLKPKDKIVAVNGKETRSWEEVVKAIASNSSSKELDLRVEREGFGYLHIKVFPVIADNKPRIGIWGGEIITQRDLKNAIPNAINYSIYEVMGLSAGFYKIVAGQVAIKDSLGGPLAIVSVGNKVKSDSGLLGIFLFAAFINFNLGILNLLPIPILDGGGIMILLVESIIRRPINPRLRNALQLAGLGLLLAIMILAISNDISHLFNK